MNVNMLELGYKVKRPGALLAAKGFELIGSTNLWSGSALHCTCQTWPVLVSSLRNVWIFNVLNSRNGASVLCVGSGITSSPNRAGADDRNITNTPNRSGLIITGL